MITAANNYRFWLPEDIQMLCLKNDYFNSGTNRHYNELYKYVRENDPSEYHIKKVAETICFFTSRENKPSAKKVADQIWESVIREVPCHFEDDTLNLERKTISIEKFKEELKALNDQLQKELADWGFNYHDLELALVKGGVARIGVRWRCHGKVDPNDAIGFAEAIKIASKIALSFKYDGYLIQD